MNGKSDEWFASAEDANHVNFRTIAKLLSNFLEGIKLASITPKRFMLQTGAKHYGIHLGPAIAPQHESDPRVQLEPNFYYPQEDLLFDYCKKTGVEWNVVRPSSILGAVKDAAMNLAYPLAVFGAVHAYLGRPLVYPASLTSFQTTKDLSSAMMNGYLEEWAVLTPDAGDQAFNASDSSEFSLGKFWFTLAQWYGVGYKMPDENTEYRSIQMPYEPPPRGYVTRASAHSDWPCRLKDRTRLTTSLNNPTGSARRGK